MSKPSIRSALIQPSSAAARRPPHASLFFWRVQTMLESPVWPPGQIKEAPKLLSPKSSPLLPQRLLPQSSRSYRGNRGDGKPSVPAIDPAPGSGRVPAVSSRPRAPPNQGRVSAELRPSASGPRPIDGSRRPAPPPPRSIDNPGSTRNRAIHSRPPTSGPRPIDGSQRPAPPPRSIDDPRSTRLPLRPVNSLHPAARPRRLDDPGSLRPTDDNLPHPAIDSRPRAPRLRTSIGVDNPRPSRLAAPRASFGVSGSCKPSPPVNKEVEEADNEIQKLNELRLGDDISYEEYCSFRQQLPEKPDIDILTKLDAVQLKELQSVHELYRKSYQLSHQVPKVEYPPSRPEEKRLLKRHQELDWSFHPDYCEIAGLEDYQRLVPRNYGGFEYVKWDEYHKNFHSYEIEQEYIKYCEKLSKELKWMEAYVPNKYPSLKWGRIVTRGTYQAIKIATGFSKITAGLAFSGFYEWLGSMKFDVYCCNEFDGVYYEIWQRYTNEKKFRDALDEVYKLNRFPLRQDRMRCALENDMFCSDMKEEFLACTTCLEEFTEDKANVTEGKARELIMEALRKEKPKFYEEYCRKKIDIARAIGLISS